MKILYSLKDKDIKSSDFSRIVLNFFSLIVLFLTSSVQKLEFLLNEQLESKIKIVRALTINTESIIT